MKSGFLRVAAAAPAVNVADVDFNLSHICSALDALASEGVELAVFPELSVTAYTCADLFHSSTLLKAAEQAVAALVEKSLTLDMAFAVGVPVRFGGALYNCAAFIRGGHLDLVVKSFLPDYNEFYERRWFATLPKNSGPLNLAYAGVNATLSSGTVFDWHGALVGIELCEDLWVSAPPSSSMALRGADVILNLSASDDQVGKYDYLTNLVIQQSARCICAYVYAGAGFGESSTDLVFDAKAIVAENGRMLASAPRWTSGGTWVIADTDIEAIRRDRLHTTTFADCASASGLSGCNSSTFVNDEPSDLKYRQVSPRPFVPEGDALGERCAEITAIQTAGLARRLDFIKCCSLTVGISGGLDSTLALLVAVRAFDRLGLDRKGIIAVTMPGFGTTGRTYNNALSLMKGLGVTIREVPIGDAVKLHFRDIGHDPEVRDVTYENSQARERTQILMDIANQSGGIVLGTGDLSELALGWATYNGDHMSMYGVNAGVPKTLVRHLVSWFATLPEMAGVSETLLDILDTPVSPELLPATADGHIAQKTEDLVGPYELHDFFLYYTLRYGFSPERILMLARKAFSPEQYDDATIEHWLKTFVRRFFSQQFKRSCMPDGPKVGSVCLSPRGDWRMPSDASSALWSHF